ncbi:MAG: leucine--tRNA ligase [Pseudomonadota bacterium]
MKYDPKAIEPKWQQYWETNKTFKTPNDFTRPKYYVLDMFPYPSGSGLHIGHPEGYTATDIIARYKRMRGFNVLHPMGWDAFGLPTERAALREGRHPLPITQENITTFRRQIKEIGLSYDWDREIDTSTPDYYKWTQWIFLKLHEKGLAYLSEVPVNWCPAQGTVLANEEVQDGKYVETGDPVERRIMRQWMLKITAYAERLLNDLDTLDWPSGILEMQRHWIGKSEGARIAFPVEGSDATFEVFTTRPDTLFGATFCVLAPEHPIVPHITTAGQKADIDAYIAKCKNISDLDRETAAAKQKTGVFTGATATNPANGEKLPIWIADYVRADYGSGAIMAVPGHDQRDYDFAKAFDLPITEVVSGGDLSQEAFGDDGVAVNSDFLNGLPTAQAKEKMLTWLADNKLGQRETTYKLRDWLFSRQRYWGEPFPILHNDATGAVVPLGLPDLPLTLPMLEDFRPTADGNPPLARAKDWLHITKDGQAMTRETNSMPQWAGSCWYFLRFMDPHNAEAAWGKEAEKYWGQVDLYVGGAEHAVLHLLYARFWYKVLYDCGLVSHAEPFQKLFNQGMILGISYWDEKGKYYNFKDVEWRDGKPFVAGTNTALSSREEKMSKSKYNVISPDDVIAAHGADALRLYEMFLGPLDASKPWQTNGIKGVVGFLERAWSLVIDAETGTLNKVITDAPENTASEAVLRELNVMIHKLTQDIETLRMNTAIAKMMEFVNVCKKETAIPKAVLEKFVLALSPFAPHAAEELWQRLGHTNTLAYETWPEYDAKWLVTNDMTIVIAVNGKKRGDMLVARTLSEDEIKDLAQREIANKLTDPVKKVIYVKDKLVNFIV